MTITPLGGQYNWEGPDSYPYAGISVFGTTASVETMLKVDAVIDEAWRVLKPGGRMVHLDFLPDDDAFRRFIHYGHARRNNEPYMEPLADLDLLAILRRKGFVDVAIQPFEEADGTLVPGYPNWRFPWSVIAARRASPSG